MTPLPPSPFVTDLRFELDEDAFAKEIDDDLPAFIASPSSAYLAAVEIEPLLKTLFQRAGGGNASTFMA